MKNKIITASQIQNWLDRGLLDTPTAEKLTADLQIQPETGSHSKIAAYIFGGIGAIAFGLGVILLFAYNWEGMTRFTKMGLVLLPLILAYGTAFWLQCRGNPRWQWETAYLLGAMFFGAGIALVAQIYHINEHFPNGFLIAAFASGALFLILKSVPQGILSAIIFCIWFGTEIHLTELNSPLVLAAPYAALLIYGLMALRLRSALLVICTMGLFTFMAMGTALCEEASGHLTLLLLVLIPTFWTCLTMLIPQNEKFKIFRNTAIFLSAAMVTFGLFFLSQPWIWEIIRSSHDMTPVFYVLLTFIGLVTFASLILYFIQQKTVWPIREWICYMGIPGAACAVTALFALFRKGSISSADAMMISFILSVFFGGLLMLRIWTGCREKRLGKVILNTLVLVLWLTLNFFFWFEDLVLRGTAFLSIGILLIAIAVLYTKLSAPSHIKND